MIVRTLKNHKKEIKMGNLSLDDVDNLKKRFPMATPEAINWVVAGGGAVKFLLTANFVHRHGNNLPFVESLRDHKDLDIYVFQSENSCWKIRYPLEIIGTFWGNTYKQFNYNERDIDFSQFFIELLTAYYYGFPIPELQQDTTSLLIDDNHLFTLTPEYLIASRLFNARGIRKGIDDVDVKALIGKFHIDVSRIHQIVKKGSFPFFTEEMIREILQSGNFTSIDAEIKTRAEEVFRHLPHQTRPINSDLLYRNLFKIAESGINEKRFRCAVNFVSSNICITTSPESTDKLFWTFVFFAYHLDNQKYKKRLYKKIQEVATGINTNERHNTWFAIAAETCQALTEFRESLVRKEMELEFEHLAARFIERLFETQFRNVLLAELNFIPSKLAKCREVPEVHNIIQRFAKLIGWRGWKPQGGLQ